MFGRKGLFEEPKGGLELLNEYLLVLLLSLEFSNKLLKRLDAQFVEFGEIPLLWGRFSVFGANRSNKLSRFGELALFEKMFLGNERNLVDPESP